ncbi:MAG: NAD(P)-binding domain-containing protein [Acidimicrobiales bacterium]
MTTILYDDDITRRLSASDAVRWMGEAIDAHHRGDLVAPPRAHADLGEGRIVFTTGRLRGSWFGYRSYDTLPAWPGSQVVVVHDDASGEVRAIAIGNDLGRRRVGAIGGVAAAALAPPTATVGGLIGTGRQAEAQLWALSAVTDLREVRVFSRNPARREAFAERADLLTGVACRAVASPREAVDGAQIVVLATSSPTPVIDAGWIEPGAYVTTLGPKQQGHAEFGLDLPAVATLLVTDSLAQLDAYDPPNVLSGTPQRERLVSLGAIRAGETARPEPGGISLFFSVGLAGTEAFLLDRLARSIP